MHNFVCGTLTLFLLKALNSTQITNAFLIGLNKKYEYSSTVRIGKAIIRREMIITKVPKLNARSHFCGLPSRSIDRICRACIEIHQSVSNNFKYDMLKDVSAGDCELQLAEFDGAEGANLAHVYVRACPIVPELYISRGNKAGWVILYSPSAAELGGQLKTLVHLGPFDSLLSIKKLVFKYLIKPMKVPSI